MKSYQSFQKKKYSGIKILSQNVDQFPNLLHHILKFPGFSVLWMMLSLAPLLIKNDLLFSNTLCGYSCTFLHKPLVLANPRGTCLVFFFMQCSNKFLSSVNLGVELLLKLPQAWFMSSSYLIWVFTYLVIGDLFASNILHGLFAKQAR